jgi:hypothetical protein
MKGCVDRMRRLDWEKENLFDITGKVINRYMEENNIQLSKLLTGQVKIPSLKIGKRVANIMYEVTGDSVYLEKIEAIANTVAYIPDASMVAGTSKVTSWPMRRHKLVQAVCTNCKSA